MRVITFANQKGGVGKTTTSHIVSIGLAKRGYKVLALDLDPQSSLTYLFGIDAESEDIDSIYEVICQGVPVKDVIKTTESGVDLIPGSILMTKAITELTGEISAPYRLKKVIKELEAEDAFHYDFMIVDTPPALNILNHNAFAATNNLFIVASPDYLSSKGLEMFNEQLISAREYLGNPNLKIDGVLIVRYDRTNATKDSIQKFAKFCEENETKIMETKIRNASAIRSSQNGDGGSSLYSMRASKVLKDYEDFIEELLQKVQEG